MIQKGRFEMENKLYDIVIVGGRPRGFYGRAVWAHAPDIPFWYLKKWFPAARWP